MDAKKKAAPGLNGDEARTQPLLSGRLRLIRPCDLAAHDERYDIEACLQADRRVGRYDAASVGAAEFGEVGC